MHQARVVDLDGWTALPAFVPPNERRGLVLIDPPLRGKGRVRAAGRTAFAEAFAKWPTGSYLLWYPVKSRRATDTLARACRRAAAGTSARRQMPAAGISVAPAGSRAACSDLGRPARSSTRHGRWQAELEDYPARTGKAARPGRRRPLPAGDARSRQGRGRVYAAANMPAI